MFSLQKELEELEKAQAKSRSNLLAVANAHENLPSLIGTAAEGVEPSIMVNPLYGAKMLIQFGGSFHTAKQFTPLEALRIIERFQLASVAVVKARGSAAIRCSYFPLGEDESYKQGSGYFPAYLEADSFDATLRAWVSLNDGTKATVYVHLKDRWKYVSYKPADRRSIRGWGTADDERVTQWEARPTIKATQIQGWWGANGKSHYTYLWTDAREAFEALEIPFDGFTANFIQE